MASKKSSNAKATQTYSARAEDLKILGYVEAVSEKEALKKARKQFGAKSVELRDQAKSDGETPAANGPADKPMSKGKTKATKGKNADAAEPETAPVVSADKKKVGKKSNKEAKPKKLSALDAAAKVLEEAAQPMNCQEMIDAMAAKGYWSSPKGLTPAATIYSAILSEVKTKGKEARFAKTERGKFAATGKA